MKKTPLLALGLITLLLTFVTASLVTQYMYPHTATVTALTLTTYIEETEWSNNTEIPWGALTAGETVYYNLTVLNTGNVDATVQLLVTGLPADWTLTWMGNNTLLTPDTAVKADLVLYVAETATQGAYSWDSTIIGTEV